jgi:hypothetical protein
MHKSPSWLTDCKCSKLMPDIPALKNITYSNTTLFVVPHNRLISFNTSSFLMIPMPSFSNTDTYIYTTSCIIRLFLYICSFLCILLPFFHIRSLDVRLLSEFIEKMVTLEKYIEIVCAYGAYKRNIVDPGAGNADSHHIQ